MAEIDRNLFSSEPSKPAATPSPEVDTSLFGEEEPTQQPKGFFDMTPPGGSFKYPDTTKTVAGGVLKAVEGVVTLPFDINAVTGGKDSKAVADKVRKKFPSIDPDTPLEDMGQKLVQYGLPSATAMKLVNGVMKGSKWAVRVTSDILAGGATDFLVADPSESTIGDITGGPTAKKKGESALKTRLKIGAEGTLIAGALIPPGSGLTAAGRWVKTRVLPTDKMIRTALSETLRKMTLNPEEAIENIRAGLKEYSDSAFQPTSGTLSKDTGLIQFEKATGTQSKYAQSAARMNDRKQANLQNVSDQLERVTKQMGGDGEDAVRFFYEYLDNAFTGKKNAYELASRKLDAQKSETKNAISEFADDAKLEPTVSGLLNDTATNELNRITAKKNELYGAIDPNHNVFIPKDRIRAAYMDMFKRRGPLDLTPQKIPENIKARFWDVLKKPKKETGGIAGFVSAPKKPQQPKNLTFGDIQDIMFDISEAISTARANNQGGVVKRMVEFKKALQREAKYLEIEGAPEVAERVVQANKYYAEEYVPRFKEFVGSNFRKAIRQNKPWPASDFSRRFLGLKNGSVEAAEQLKLITSGAKNATEAGIAAENYITGILAEQLYGIDNMSTAMSKVDRFLNQREIRDTLKAYPGAKKRVMDFRKSLISRGKVETVLGNKVSEAQSFMKFTEKEINLNSAKWFIDKDPVAAMRRVLDSPNPNQAMDHVLTLAKQDRSGKAKKGLRSALHNLIESPRSRGGVRLDKELKSGKNFEVSSARLQALLEYEPTRKAISKLYTPQEMKVLSDMHKKIRVMDRINLQVPKGSPTAILEESVRSGQVLAFSMFGIVKGRGIFMVSRKIQEMLGRDPVEKAWVLLTDSMLDPDLAAALLKEGSEKSWPKVKAKVTTHLLNNFTMED